ncbi:MAG: hypothetical protein LQ346_006782 [Caloplaca aetnensis]|nr:MAG: hypothetical protein LQ346_006782 [Caloplaca aetnensis]
MSQSRSDVDIELALPSTSEALPATRLTGFPSLADFIAADADAAIYRKYERLSARNLLYLQSALHELDRKLQELDAEDVKEGENCDREAQKRARLWPHYARGDNERATRHRQLQEEIESKLKAYHKALILENQVLKLSAPTPRVLKAFQRWFQSNPRPVLWGPDKDLFRDERDLVALAPVDTDRLNIFLQKYFGWFLQVCNENLLIRREAIDILFSWSGEDLQLLQEKREKDTQDQGDDIFYFPTRRIQRVGAVISIFLSAILLVGAIGCLAKVERHKTDLRIGLIVLFTCLFAVVVGLLTNARRAEIFASTAAWVTHPQVWTLWVQSYTDPNNL